MRGGLGDSLKFVSYGVQFKVLNVQQNTKLNNASDYRANGLQIGLYRMD